LAGDKFVIRHASLKNLVSKIIDAPPVSMLALLRNLLVLTLVAQLLFSVPTTIAGTEKTAKHFAPFIPS